MDPRACPWVSTAEGLLRQALTKAGIDVPLIVNLDINKYLSSRGKKKLTFDPNVFIHDPFGTEEKLVTVTLRQ